MENRKQHFRYILPFCYRKGENTVEARRKLYDAYGEDVFIDNAIIYIRNNFHTVSKYAVILILDFSLPPQTFANRLFGVFAWTIPVFVALSTFGAVNGILLTSSRLFYAGACEGQMPEILTMIQTSRVTPTPAVICMVCWYFMYSWDSSENTLIKVTNEMEYDIRVFIVRLLRELDTIFLCLV